MASPTLRQDNLPHAPSIDTSQVNRRGLRDRGFPAPSVLIGAAALGIAMASMIALPPNLLSVVLGVVAVAGLSREPRLGVLPAGLLALIAVPYGRAADNGLAEIAGIPWRFQDGVVLASLVLALPSLRHANLRTGISRLIAAFLVVGAVGVVIGLVEGNGTRDILRDMRWWGLYGFGLLALWSGTDRRAIARGLLIGATLFSFVLIALVLLPVFEGGLESRALTYDWGRLRLQFSNSIFIIASLAYVVSRVATRPRVRDVLWLLLLSTAIVLSVTRMSIVAGIGTIGLAFVWAVWQHRSSLTVRRVITSGVLVLVILTASLAGALGLVTAGAAVTTPVEVGDPGGQATDGGEIFDRIMFQDPNSSVGAIERGPVRDLSGGPRCHR